MLNGLKIFLKLFLCINVFTRICKEWVTNSPKYFAFVASISGDKCEIWKNGGRLFTTHYFTTSQVFFINCSDKKVSVLKKYLEKIYKEINALSRPIHLYLIFEKSSLKNQVQWTSWIFNLQKSISKWFLQAKQAVKIQFNID